METLNIRKGHLAIARYNPAIAALARAIMIALFMSVVPGAASGAAGQPASPAGSASFFGIVRLEPIIIAAKATSSRETGCCG